MARNHSTESTSFRESVDSCFNKAFCMSSHDTVSNTTLDRTEDFSRTVSTASFISNTSTLARTMTSQFATDSTATSEFPENDPSTSWAGVSSSERVKSRPTRCCRRSTESGNNSTPNETCIDPENSTFTGHDTPHKMEKESCEKKDSGSGGLENSHLWPILTSLQKNLCASGDHEAEEADQIVHDLYVSFNSDPLEFTDHLLTIIEESSLLSMSGTSTASGSLLSRLGRTDSTRYKSLRGFESNGAKGSDCSGSFVVPETPASFKAAGHSVGISNDSPMLENLENKTLTKTARVYGVPRSSGEQKSTEETPESSISSVALGECSSKNFGHSAYPQTPRPGREVRAKSSTRLAGVRTPRILKKNYSAASNVEIPKIVLIPDTPAQHISRAKKCCFENDPESPTGPETDESNFRSPDLSKVSTRCEDRGEKLESGKERETAYIAKWERRWLRQLAKKREKCYLPLMRLMENRSVDKGEECTCPDCIVSTDFYRTMIVCDDYYISTNFPTENHRRSETRVLRKTHRSVSRSRKLLTNQEVASNSQTPGKPPKKVSRKSIGRKSPAGKSKSPRHSVVVKPNMRSPFRSRGSRARPIPEIDRSSIRSVAQLRKVFSPGTTKSSDSAVTKIPLPQKFGPRTFVTTCVISNSVSRTSPTNLFTSGRTTSNKNYRHIKSPVGEYIRGTKVIRPKNVASPNER